MINVADIECTSMELASLQAQARIEPTNGNPRKTTHRAGSYYNNHHGTKRGGRCASSGMYSVHEEKQALGRGVTYLAGCFRYAGRTAYFDVVERVASAVADEGYVTGKDSDRIGVVIVRA